MERAPGRRAGPQHALLQLLVPLLALCGVAFAVWCVWLAATGVDRSNHQIALGLALAVAAFAASSFPIRFGQDDMFVALDSVPLLLAAFFLPLPDAVLIGVATTIWALHSHPLPRTPKAIVSYAGELGSASLSLGITALIAAAWLGGGDSAPVLLLPALAGALCLELLTDGMVVAGISYTHPGSARDFLRSAGVPATAQVVLSTIALLALSPYMDRTLLAVLLLAVLLVGMYFALWVANSQQLEKKRSAHLKDTFSRYVPESVVGEHFDQMQQVRLGGEQREITVLFCDIRGFTSWSENREASEIITELNALLSELSAAVMESEGTLDKYTGDGLMAFWGAPLPREDHAARACDAALEMLVRLETVNERRVHAGQEPFAIGVGVHTGLAVVGNVGHEQRLDYTAIGDTVNLAARLEAATKDIGSVLLVSRDTVVQLPDEFRARSLRIGEITVKGRRQPVEVHALQPRRPELDGLADDPDMLVA